jgi:ribosomal protein L11 methylase PrmA
MSVMTLSRLKAVLDVLESVVAETVLDLGCNDGSITMLVAERVGARRVYGLDLDEEALTKASKRGLNVFKVDLVFLRIACLGMLVL